MKKDILQTAKIITLGAILALGVSFAHAVWVGPTAPPPLNNASAPLNVGNTTQTKAGDIILDDGVNTAGLVADTLDASIVTAASKFCIGPSCITAWPSGGGGNIDFSNAGVAQEFIFCGSGGGLDTLCKNNLNGFPYSEDAIRFVSLPNTPAGTKAVIIFARTKTQKSNGLLCSQTTISNKSSSGRSSFSFYTGNVGNPQLIGQQIEVTQPPVASYGADVLVIPLTDGKFGVSYSMVVVSANYRYGCILDIRTIGYIR